MGIGESDVGGAAFKLKKRTRRELSNGKMWLGIWILNCKLLFNYGPYIEKHLRKDYGIPIGSDGKESAYNAGRPRFDP